MKLWKKIYFVTLLMSLLLINAGIYTLFSLTYSRNLQSEKSKSMDIFKLLDTAIEKNLETLYEDQRLGDAQLQALLTNYETYYGDENIFLGMMTDDRIVYSNIKEPDKDKFQGQDYVISMYKEDGIPRVLITTTIDKYDETLYFYYSRPLTELYSTWKDLKRKYLAMTIGISSVLSVFLITILRRLTKPIGRLGDAVNDMKSSDFSRGVHIEVKGSDDIADLSRNFNEMSYILADNVKTMKKDNESKQQFIDNFAHELKSPLTSIYGYAEYVKNVKISGEEQQRYMEIIMAQCKRMMDMSYSLLDLSELRNKTIIREEIKVENLKYNVQEVLSKKLREKSMNLIWENTIDTFKGNKELMESLIVNLVKNGINASAEGTEVKVVICKEKNGIIIYVKDHGCGMEEGELQHIFEAFYRIDKSRSRENGGNGIGLSLCREIVTAHEGSIHVDSEKGVGTTVCIQLPQ